MTISRRAPCGPAAPSPRWVGGRLRLRRQGRALGMAPPSERAVGQARVAQPHRARRPPLPIPTRSIDDFERLGVPACIRSTSRAPLEFMRANYPRTAVAVVQGAEAVRALRATRLARQADSGGCPEAGGAAHPAAWPRATPYELSSRAGEGWALQRATPLRHRPAPALRRRWRRQSWTGGARAASAATCTCGTCWIPTPAPARCSAWGPRCHLGERAARPLLLPSERPAAGGRHEGLASPPLAAFARPKPRSRAANARRVAPHRTALVAPPPPATLSAWHRRYYAIPWKYYEGAADPELSRVSFALRRAPAAGRRRPRRAGRPRFKPAQVARACAPSLFPGCSIPC